MKKIMMIVLAMTAATHCITPEIAQANREKAAQARRMRAHLKETLTAGTLALSGLAIAAVCARGFRGSSGIMQKSSYAAGFTLATGWALAGLAGLAVKVSRLAQQATTYLSDDEYQNQ